LADAAIDFANPCASSTACRSARKANGTSGRTQRHTGPSALRLYRDRRPHRSTGVCAL